jgi:hypothetical protein
MSWIDNYHVITDIFRAMTLGAVTLNVPGLEATSTASQTHGRNQRETCWQVEVDSVVERSVMNSSI